MIHYTVYIVRKDGSYSGDLTPLSVDVTFEQAQASYNKCIGCYLPDDVQYTLRIDLAGLYDSI